MGGKDINGAEIRVGCAVSVFSPFARRARQGKVVAVTQLEGLRGCTCAVEYAPGVVSIESGAHVAVMEPIPDPGPKKLAEVEAERDRYREALEGAYREGWHDRDLGGKLGGVEYGDSWSHSDARKALEGSDE